MIRGTDTTMSVCLEVPGRICTVHERTESRKLKRRGRRVFEKKIFERTERGMKEVYKRFYSECPL